MGDFLETTKKKAVENKSEPTRGGFLSD